MKPHWAIVIPLESASIGKNELMIEEEIPERRSEEHNMIVLVQCMLIFLKNWWEEGRQGLTKLLLSSNTYYQVLHTKLFSCVDSVV